jgi:hypothetical protein
MSGIPAGMGGAGANANANMGGGEGDYEGEDSEEDYSAASMGGAAGNPFAALASNPNFPMIR